MGTIAPTLPTLSYHRPQPHSPPQLPHMGSAAPNYDRAVTPIPLVSVMRVIRYG